MVAAARDKRQCRPQSKMAGDRSTPGVTSQQLEARARALLHLSERLHHRQLQAWMWHCVYTLFNELAQHVLRRACMLTRRVLRLHADRRLRIRSGVFC